MAVFNTKSAYDEKLELIDYASQSAGNTTSTAVKTGALREGSRLVINIGVVGTSATLNYVVYGSTDDSTYYDIHTTDTWSATGQHSVPIGHYTDPNGDALIYFKIKSTVANAAVSHGAYVAL